MNSTSWIPVVLGDLGGFVKKKIKGTIVNVGPSPHDIPTLLRTTRDKDLHRIVLEARYIDEEDLVECEVSKDVTAEVGRRSGRVYKVIVTVAQSPNKMKVIPEFERALHTIQSQSTGRKVTNADILEKAVERTARLDELIPAR